MFFLWHSVCLYGNRDNDNLQDIINFNAQREGIYQSSVTIFAKQEGENFSIIRDISLRGNINVDISGKDFRSTLVITKGDISIAANDESEKIDYINSIVHEDAAQYFFFDGEKINDYSIVDGTEYREAIARILGIKEVENAIDDLKRIAKEYEKIGTSVSKKQNTYNDILQQKKTSESSVQGFERLDNAYQTEIQEGNALVAKHEEELKKFTEIGERVTKRQELNQEIKEHERELSLLEKERQKIFQKNATIILGEILFARFDRDKSEQAASPYLTGAVQQYLKHLLTGSKCICGEDMTPEHSRHIQEFIQTNLVTDEPIIIAQEREALFHSLSKILYAWNRE